MTIAVVIRTSTAVVFSADSKATTQGLVGFRKNNKAIWELQTYDNAVKVVRGLQKSFMAMVVGHANVGQIPAVDFFSRQNLGRYMVKSDQDNAVSALVDMMVNEKQKYWSQTKVPQNQWPGPTVLLATHGFDQITPRVWSIDLHRSARTIREILTAPDVRLSGSFSDSFALLYGFRPDVLYKIGRRLGRNRTSINKAAYTPKGFLRPIDKMNFHTMPVQAANIAFQLERRTS
jgi:hypothetical protein